ncbi:WD-40 repeat-containing protein [Franzmannia pantelleriensis]|uniref:WD-40 repeat-containing protein n=1 Tax=Franzmannia pantelleriensis TaxID=48727 RepID=A0A1G9P801_9GAMM|nr:WD40 repeat domain-containing protein [Halomonas pantelleriensis]SDL94641.1 WD-40 repeat-containing protein [Halomonas pantelleriensis]
MNQPASILEQLGHQWQWSAYILSACFDASNNLAFALGDGSLRLLPAGASQTPQRVEVHDDMALSMAPAPGTGFVSGGDDGRCVQLGMDGSIQALATFPGRWVDHVASHSNGVVACSEGKRLHLFAAGRDDIIREFPSTVGGICFSPDGHRIAVAHYGGVTLCSTRSADASPVALTCPGSHLSVTWSPNARFVLSAMQEDCIRGWRLEDNDDLYMSGYATKVKSWSWFNGGHYLATSGSNCAPCWPFKGRKGPRGHTPKTPGDNERALVTAVAGDPQYPLLGIGYDDGQVTVADIEKDQEVVIKPPGHGAVTTMAWSADGAWLAFGTDKGFAGLFPVSG